MATQPEAQARLCLLCSSASSCAAKVERSHSGSSLVASCLASNVASGSRGDPGDRRARLCEVVSRTATAATRRTDTVGTRNAPQAAQVMLVVCNADWKVIVVPPRDDADAEARKYIDDINVIVMLHSLI